MRNFGHSFDLLSKELQRHSCPTIGDAWEGLLVDGWTIVADRNSDLGFDPTFREYVNSTYFGEQGKLEPEKYDVFPPDRKRARGAVEISFNAQGEPTLEDMPPTPVINQDRGTYKGERFYTQIKLMDDPRFRHWLTVISGLIPPLAEHIPGVVLDSGGGFNPNVLFDRYGRLPLSSESNLNVPFYAALTGQVRQRIGSQALRSLSGGGLLTAGINLFEVNRDVVSGPHQDNTLECYNGDR